MSYILLSVANIRDDPWYINGMWNSIHQFIWKISYKCVIVWIIVMMKVQFESVDLSPKKKL